MQPEKEQSKPKVSRRKEIKIRAEINEIEIKKKIEKINENKAGLWKDILDKSLARLIKNKRERVQVNGIRNEKKNYNGHNRNTKNHKRLLQATMCQ